MTRALEKISPFIVNETQFSYLPTGGDAPRPPPNTYRAPVYEKRSLDFPSRLEQKLAQYNASQSILKRWLFEIISVTTSAICMGASLHAHSILCTSLTNGPKRRNNWTIVLSQWQAP
jgi:hypothetical protein